MRAAPGAGTTPPGAQNEEQASRWVRSMFARVSGRYDLLNHTLSFQADRYWRRRTVRRLRPVLERPGARVMDLCCGTGDLLLALQSARKSQQAELPQRIEQGSGRRIERHRAQPGRPEIHHPHIGWQ